MALRGSATMQLIDYAVEDGGVRFHFLCPDPGAGENSDYYVFLTNLEISSSTSDNALKTKLSDALKRRYRNVGFTRGDTLVATAYSTVI